MNMFGYTAMRQALGQDVLVHRPTRRVSLGHLSIYTLGYRTNATLYTAG
jgi:hypothetical protein